MTTTNADILRNIFIWFMKLGLKAGNDDFPTFISGKVSLNKQMKIFFKKYYQNHFLRNYYKNPYRTYQDFVTEALQML